MSLFPKVYAWLTGDAAVAALVGTKVYREVAEPVSAPYIVWSVLAAPPENNLGAPPGDHVAVRIDCLARSEREVDSLALVARNTMERHGMVETLQSLGKEEGTGFWRIVFDVTIYHHRS